MFRSLRWKVLAVTALVFMSYGYAEPQFKESPINPGTEHLAGPAIIGDATFVDLGNNNVQVTFVGRCGNVPVTPGAVIFQGVAFNSFPGGLENFRLQGGVGQFPECYSFLLGDIIIQAVTRFVKQAPTTATAQLVILAVVPF